MNKRARKYIARKKGKYKVRLHFDGRDWVYTVKLHSNENR